MAVALIDTGELVGTADADDRHNDAASEIVHGVDRGELPTCRVTNYVILEALNWVHDRQRHETAIELYRRLQESAGFKIVHAARKDFPRAVERFEAYRGLAFDDAAIAAYMERESVEYLYSFDDDFDALEHVTRLETAVNPFN